jgi:hypothetical protein
MSRRLLRTIAVSITVTVCWTIVWHAGDAEALENADTAETAEKAGSTETTTTSWGCKKATGRSTSVAVRAAPQGRGPEHTNERL